MALSPMVTLFILEMFFSRIFDDVSNISAKLDGRGLNLCKFILYTREHSIQGQRLDPNLEESFSTFNASLDTKVIIHGFVDRVLIGEWMHDMKDEFLEFGAFNIIEVDWSVGNLIPYSRAARNTEKVGKEIAELLKYLQDNFDVMAESFHLIGHSLGSHIAGFVGERIKPIGRITGLDPAMPLFSDVHRSKRLDTSDANFVDIIHTHSDVLGMVKPLGHVDFYPNGGRHQTGCTVFEYVSTLLDRDIIDHARNLLCSHMRSVRLFIESINPRECDIIGTQCTSWNDYEEGRCTNPAEDTAMMGYRIEKDRRYGRSGYYFYTAPRSPFCVHEYRLQVFGAANSSISTPSMSLTEASVHHRPLQVTLLGKETSDGISFNIDKWNEDAQRSYVVISRKPITKVKTAILKWRSPVEDEISSITRLEIRPVNLLAPHLSDRKMSFCITSEEADDSLKNVVTLHRKNC